MEFGKQAVKMWLVTLSVLITLGLFVAIGAAQSDVKPSLSSHQGSAAVISGQAVALVRESHAPQAAAGDPAALALGKDKTAFLPLVARMEPTTTLPFTDGFDQYMSPHWTVYPFHGEDWKQDDDYGGIYWCNYDSEETDKDDWWGLSMYLGPGAELWTNYEATATLKSSKAGSITGGLAGVWLRGSYAEDGRVGGYYVHLKRRTDEVILWRLRPGARNLNEADEVSKAEYLGLGTRWYTLKVRVQGANIKAWLKDTTEPDSAYGLLFDWTDPNATYMQGTVGLSSYRSRAVYDAINVVELPSSRQ